MKVIAHNPDIPTITLYSEGFGEYLKRMNIDYVIEDIPDEVVEAYNRAYDSFMLARYRLVSHMETPPRDLPVEGK